MSDTVDIPLALLYGELDPLTWFNEAKRIERSVLNFLGEPSVLQPMDEYSFNIAPLQPLTFDRVMEEGCASLGGARNRLLDIPVEILATVISYIVDDKETLASLALVNSDCRQLARSCQFSTVCFDYRPRTWAILGHLAQEGRERDAGHGVTFARSIGTCIRRIEVRTNVSWIRYHLDLRLNYSDSQPSSFEEMGKRLERANQLYFNTYFSQIRPLLSDKSLPHLEYLNWRDPIFLERPFFNSLVRSSIQHLKLSKVCVTEDFEVEAPPSGTWPLRSLDIEIHLAKDSPLRQIGVRVGDRQSSDHPGGGGPFDHQDGYSGSYIPQDGDVSLFRLSTSILCLCAPTIETLKWTYVHDKTKMILPNPGLQEFPCLRELELGTKIKLEKPLAEALLRSHLSGLTISTESDPVISESLDEIGHMNSLERFVWSSRNIQAAQPLRFLSHNTQLKKLCIPFPASTEFLEMKLIPLLASSFLNLRSLSLCWDETSVPESSIAAVGAVVSLEQLNLSANPLIEDKDWLINHDIIRTNLYRLRNLKRLAFIGDTYTPLNPNLACDEYYTIRRPHIRDYDAAQLRPDLDGDLQEAIKSMPIATVWELSHRNRMLAEAEKYAEVLPNLEWMYFGRTTIGFKKMQPEMRRAVPLIPEDDCVAMLVKMFAHS